MRAQVGYLLFFICLFITHSQGEKSKIRVGIIGAGIGGTSAAYWLNQYLKDSVDVTIFDSGEVGGRLKTSYIGEHGYEAGGLAILENNLYMVRFTEKLGLNRIKEETRFLSFLLTNNGSETLLASKSHFGPLTFKFLWRYGFDTYRLHNLVNSISSGFSKIYEHQDAGKTYDSVKDLIESLHEDFYPATRVSLRQFLTDKGFSKQYIDELAQLATLSNYEQSANDMSALPGLFSQVSVNVPLWHVEGGNRMVPLQLLDHVIKNYGVHFVPGHVKSVKESSHNGDDDHKHDKVRVTYQVKDKEVKHEDFDYVIVSTPVHRDTKDFVLKSDTKFNPHDYPMYEVHTNFLKAKLNGPKYNLTDKEGEELNAILYCDPTLPYRSLMQPRNVYNQKTDPSHYEVCSNRKLLASDYKEIFGNDNTELVTTTEWLAYPKYEYPQPIPPMKLGKKIFYPNAIEWIGSFMEMIIVSARNTVLHIAKEQGADIKKKLKHTEF